ncbi:molybdenum cofactor guanylyltransferase [Picrophilus oshimae]|uniref:Molybdopterin-guanine dinucleotide biosynthesis protein A n=1 Tax=Picrophilus torridus (strain ATCC 700027 / DSM 9790 / JCM 10055 / NBRC 100828 / KAW 2/3) TaxID=1122961 RepID=Q6KZH4_PICTO|nr:NTP transferase domain-containing protein [Picrophilus oshimae]AAT43878.1 molybdopterin-guanine dinucleotide biosynthesis protein A [Picrophilus oshimae DSM 9789]
MISIIFAKKSERFPGKHHAMICGEEMIKRISRIINESMLFDKIILYTKDETLYSEYCDIVIDKSKGTLIDSLMSCLKEYSEFLAVGGDMPLLDYNILKYLMDNYTGRSLAVSSYGFIQPLLSIYNKSIINDLDKYILSGSKSIYKFIMKSNFKILNINTFKTMSVNTLNDLKEINYYLGC